MKGANKVKKTQKWKEQNGYGRVIDKKEAFQKDYDFSHFHPTDGQKNMLENIDRHPLTIVQAPSGCGKSATAIFKALKEYRVGNYDRIMLIKNPTEAGDDKIGFLPSDIDDKSAPHIDVFKPLFHQFIGKNKLENDVSNGNIQFLIPNFALGATWDRAFVIIEEAQTMSPMTLKLLMERAGINTKIVVLGDYKQTYSVAKRQDGLTDLINRVTYENHGVRMTHPDIPVGYAEMDSSDNMRSELSKFITDLYA